jgi:hypothetical protein
MLKLNANGAGGGGGGNESNEHFFLRTRILVRDTIDATETHYIS